MLPVGLGLLLELHSFWARILIVLLACIISYCTAFWCIRFDWIRGSFSYVKVGASRADIHALAEPEEDGRLYFAGEACNEAGNQCVHGAYTSGLRAANQVIRRWKDGAFAT